VHYKCYSYRFAEEILNSKLYLKKEIEELIAELDLDPRNTRSHHRQITELFSKKGWSTEETISKDIIMRHDLYKDRVGIEVETSHIVHTYKDYLKFLISFNADKIDVGVLVVYHDKYFEKYGLKSDKYGHKPRFSKVKRDLQLFRLVITVPIYVIGVF